MDECYKVSYPFCNVFDFVKFPIKSKPESLVPQMKCQIQIEYQEFGLKLFIVFLSIWCSGVYSVDFGLRDHAHELKIGVFLRQEPKK